MLVSSMYGTTTAIGLGSFHSNSLPEAMSPKVRRSLQTQRG